jgi:hypothetical protein
MDAVRRTENIHPDFFNDGYWYVLTSKTLGGSGLDADGIADALQAEEPEPVQALIRNGICLPLQFPGDCAMDGRTRFVLGPLSEVEDAEWIGRVQAVLNIGDGKFILMAGGTDEHFEDMLTITEQDPDAIGFHCLEVPPARYRVEVLAFVSSMTVNFAWEDPEDDEERSTRELREYWQDTRRGEDEPDWLKSWAEEGYVDSDEANLLSYIIRLEPFEGTVDVPEQDEDSHWISEFEIRRPSACPRGIPFDRPPD